MYCTYIIAKIYFKQIENSWQLMKFQVSIRKRADGFNNPPNYVCGIILPL